MPQAAAKVGMRSHFGLFSDFSPRRAVHVGGSESDADGGGDDAEDMAGLKPGVAFRIALTTFFEDMASSLHEADRAFRSLEDVHHQFATHALTSTSAPTSTRATPPTAGASPRKPAGPKRAAASPSTMGGGGGGRTVAPGVSWPSKEDLTKRLQDVITIDFLDRPLLLTSARAVTEMLREDGSWDDEVELLVFCQRTVNEFLHRHAEHYKLQIGRYFDANAGAVGGNAVAGTMRGAGPAAGFTSL